MASLLTISTWLLLLPILAILTLLILKEAGFFLIYLMKYKKQNIPLRFVPLIGWFDLFIPKNSSKNVFEKIYQKINGELKNKDLVIMNQHSSPYPIIFLFDTKLIGDLFVKEVDFFKKEIPAQLPQNQGFLMEHGQLAIKKRAIFNNFFQIENLQKLTEGIRKMIKGHFIDLKNELWKDSENIKEFKTYDLRKFFPRLFEDLVNRLLFGDSGFPIMDGKTMPYVNQKILEEFANEVVRKPLNFFTMNILHNLKIFPKTRELDKRVKHVQKKILETVRKKEKIPKSERGINILDVMIEHNETCDEKDKLTDKDFIENIFLFQIAGLDTSNNVTEMVIKHLSLYPKYIEKIQNEELKKIFAEVGDEFRYEAYYRSDFINGFINEVMRLNPVISFSIERRALKDVKIGPYTIYEGTAVTVPMYAIHNHEGNFKNPLELNPERFFEENLRKVKRNTYLPFMGGKRACIGKYLAELIVRINVATFLEIFEVEKIEGEEFENCVRLVTGTKDCKVKIRPMVEY